MAPALKAAAPALLTGLVLVAVAGCGQSSASARSRPSATKVPALVAKAKWIGPANAPAAATFEDPTAAPGEPSGELDVGIVDETMRITAANVRLDRLLREVSRQTGLVVRARGGLPERVTIRLEAMPFERALALVMGDRSYVLSYAGPLPTGRSELWILEDRTGDMLRPAEERTTGEGLELESGTTDLASIETMLSNGDSRARMDASNALTAVPGGAGLALLGTVVQRDADPEVRAQAVRALGTVCNGSTLPIIDRALSDEDSAVRTAAVEALGEVGGDEAALSIGFALQSEDAKVRARAVDELAGIGTSTAVRLLEQALADPAPGVRDAAAGYIEELSESP